MQVVTRFAPSPTGRLHLGHAFSAMRAHDFARRHGGSFLLRIEDIDGTRSRPEHVDAIIEDLSWLGLQWDGEIVYQSERLPFYAAALDRLKAVGLLYACTCTRADIAASVTAPHGAEGALYPGTCRALPRGHAPAGPHCWRLDMAAAVARAGPLHWHEGATAVAARPQLFGDVVLARKDAPASYHLAVTIDDAAQGVTDVVRGTDLFTATHVHRLLQALLDLPSPTYHHHALLTDAEGHRLAKRYNAPTLQSLRTGGVDAAELLAALRTGEMPAGYSVSPA